MRSDLLPIDVRRRLQHVERVRREVVGLRTRQHANARVAVRQRHDGAQRRSRDERRCRVRIAERQAIARRQRAAVEAAHAR